MFNIKRQIYVAYKEDVELHSEARIIYICKGASDEIEVTASADSAEPGIVGAYESYGAMMASYGGDEAKFYDFLAKEQRLWIAVEKDEDYDRLFAQYLRELQHTYGISNNHIHELLGFQKVKNFFTERPIDRDLEEIYSLVQRMYTPKGNLVTKVEELALEVVIYLYKKGYVSREDANAKLRTLTEGMLKGYISTATSHVQDDLCVDRKVLQEYTGKKSINSIDKAVKAILNDRMLYDAFFHPEFLDLYNQDVFNKVIRLAEICIDHELDYPDEAARHKGELELFVQMFRTPDIDLALKNVLVVFDNTFIKRRGQKFNKLMITALREEAEKQTTGKFVLWKSDKDDQYYFHLKAPNGQVIAESEGYTTKAAAENGIHSVKRNAPGAHTEEE